LECLRSIEEQTYPKLELIVVDDHSPDQTFAVAEALLCTAYSKRFQRVVLHRKETNQGAHDSLNFGLAQARGDYIAIINSDDRFRSDRIERLVEAVSKAESEFGFTGVDTITDSSNSEAASAGRAANLPHNFILLRLQQKLNIARDVSLGYALLRRNVAISTGNFFFSRRLAEAIGGFQSLTYCHDWDFILQALVRTEPVFVDAPLYDYRLHPGNSFRSLAHLAEAETEAVLRRFFRAIIAGEVRNPKCPRPDNDSGRFQAYLSYPKYGRYWASEGGPPLRGERDKLATTRRPARFIRMLPGCLRQARVKGSDCNVESLTGATLIKDEVRVSNNTTINLIGWLRAPDIVLSRSLPIFLHLSGPDGHDYVTYVSERRLRPDVVLHFGDSSDQMHGFRCTVVFDGVASGRFRLQFLVGSATQHNAAYVIPTKITVIVG
jgi:glycosyltransferase involved in cell wall biosynthesis